VKSFGFFKLCVFFKNREHVSPGQDGSGDVRVLQRASSSFLFLFIGLMRVVVLKRER
jgi:hypothetical protein